MSLQNVLLWTLLLLVFVFSAPQTLVVVKDDFSKYTYSRFFKSLKRRGHKITIKSATDKNIKLTEYGESLYANLIILSPASKQIGDLSYKDILTFIDNGNNLFIGVNNEYSSDFIKKIADRCGIEINPKSSKVFDHTNYDLLRTNTALNNDIILLNNWPTKLESIIRSESDIPRAPVLYNGIGMKFKKTSHLTLSLLNGNFETYSTDVSQHGPIEKSIIASGNSLSLIAALQMRNNARITFIGSLQMISDEYYVSRVKHSKTEVEYVKSGNEEFMSLISQWSFGERGILRIRNATHHQQPESHEGIITINPTRYRIKDLVTYSATIEEYSLKCDCWIPFKGNDVQFDFVRLDSFIRQLLTHDDNGNYKIDFMLPDVFGIYKFTINYQRKGWGYLFSEQLASVRPFRHDEYQRFLITAYPYYLGCASMIIGFAIFTIVFLFGTVNDKKDKKSKSKRKVWN